MVENEIVHVETQTVDVNRALEDWQTYQELTEKLLNKNDYQPIGGKQFKKKSAWRKYMRAFNISTRVVEKEIIKNDQGRVTEASFTVRAWTPDGRESEGWGNCSRFEKRGFNKPNHDIPSTAMTRAVNRAISDLIGAGEVSAEEMTVESNNRSTPQNKSNNAAAKKPARKPKSSTPKSINPNNVQNAEVTIKDPDWKALAQKSKPMKKVCDNITQGGFDLDTNTVWVEAGHMHQNKKLTDQELDEIEILLGKKPA